MNDATSNCSMTHGNISESDAETRNRTPLTTARRPHIQIGLTRRRREFRARLAQGDREVVIPLRTLIGTEETGPASVVLRNPTIICCTSVGVGMLRAPTVTSEGGRALARRRPAPSPNDVIQFAQIPVATWFHRPEPYRSRYVEDWSSIFRSARPLSRVRPADASAPSSASSPCRNSFSVRSEIRLASRQNIDANRVCTFQKEITGLVLGMPLKEYEGGSALSHEHIDAGGLGARQNLISVGGECCLRKAIIAGVRNPPLPRQATYQRMRLRDGLATQNIGNLGRLPRPLYAIQSQNRCMCGQA